jgi:hypothetical protein
MVTVIEAPFVTTPAHIVISMKSKPKIIRETQLVNVHTKMPREVNKVFVGKPLDQGGGRLDPTRPPRPLELLGYFGLPKMNLGKAPLPSNRPYC